MVILINGIKIFFQVVIVVCILNLLIFIPRVIGDEFGKIWGLASLSIPAFVLSMAASFLIERYNKEDKEK